jgi:hypothetical protein
MNGIGKGFILCVLAIFLTGCADLVVSHVEVNWSGTNRTARADIANLGNRSAGPFLVYFDADENPVSPNHRPQVRHQIPGLAPNASVQLEADFAPLAHPDNHDLANVYQITVIADPKKAVKEWDEANNTRSERIPLPSLVSPYNLTPAGNVAVDNAQWAGQTFTMTQSGRLLGIEVAAVRCNATASDQLTLEIGQGTTSLGSRTIIGAGMLGPGQCGVVPAALTLADTGPGYFDLSGLNLTLTAGQTYYFKLTNPATRDFRIGMSDNVYGGGGDIVNGTPSIHDLVFKILVQP